MGRYKCTNAPVGQKKPVKLVGSHKLSDLSGNVYEWCWDWYDANYYAECYQDGAVLNPADAKSSSAGRVIRGGCWDYPAENCRVAFRSRDFPDGRFRDVGFRLAFVP